MITMVVPFVQHLWLDIGRGYYLWFL